MRISVFPTLALALVCGTQAVFAGEGVWTPLGPDGAQVTSLAVDPQDPSFVYASTLFGGVFRSPDGGRSWTGASAGLGTRDGFLQAHSLAVDLHDSSIVYAATRLGVFKSTDRGDRWRWLNAGPTADGHLLRGARAVALHPRERLTVYVATDGGVFQSLDGGLTWRRRSRGLAERRVLTLALSPLDGALYAGTADHRLFASRDRGRSWQPASGGLPHTATVLCLAHHPTRDGVVLAGTDNGLFRTTDGGGRWARVTGPARFGRVFALAFPSRHRALAGVEGEVHSSSDDGATWQRRGAPPAEGFVFALAVGPTALYAGIFSQFHPTGVFKSADDGASWQPAFSGLVGTPAEGLAFDDTDPQVIYAGLSGAGLFRTVDGGKHWVRLDPGLVDGASVVSLSTDRRHPGSVLLAAFEAGVVLLRSDDRGETWRRLGTPPGTIVRSLVFDPSAPETLWAAGQGLFRSVDGGVRWEPVQVVDAMRFLWSVVFDPESPQTLWVAGSAIAGPEKVEPGIFLSEDGGATWERRDDGLEEAVVALQLVLDSAVPGRLYVATFLGSYRSDDSGRGWRLLSALGGREHSLAVAPGSPSILYAGQSLAYDGPLKSLDGGETWISIRRGLGRRSVLLAVDPHDPSHLVAATGNGGLWTYTEPDAP